MANKNNTVEYIVAAANEPEKFIAQCENRYNNKIKRIALEIAQSGRTEIVMIAGPSSAGKTTSAKKLREHLLEYGIRSHTVSLDDYYVDNCDAPRFPDGTPDFETVDALDIACFQKTMGELLTKGETELPEFDFLEGKRKKEYRHIEISDRDVIIVEGLHALNPKITDHLPAERLLKIYINLSSRIYDAKGNIVLNKRNMRFVRRMVRDYKFRGNSVERSYKMWLTVRYGEDTYLFPFKNNADIKLNTIHLYESCILKDTAVELLKELPKASEFYKESQRLIRSLQKFPSISSDSVPDDSLMREFIGPKES
ncbi:MAG: nucleoside kinase [Clostridia bacterium]|nr:nucleoside kinase [Clostridia bacterium]